MLNEKKPISEGYILYDSTYTTLLKWQNYTNGNRLVAARGYWEGWDGKKVDKMQHEGS